MKSSRAAALVLAGATLIYIVLIGQIGWGLVRSGDPVGIGLGFAILVFPLFGIWFIWRELAFGFRAQRLEAQWEAEGLPVPENTPEAFEAAKAEVEEFPDDWHCWFRLGLAYAVAGDKSRARSSIRHAEHLFRRGETA